MQILHTSAGDGVAVMGAKEVLVIESALSLYVLEHPDSNLAVRMLADVSRVNEEREAAMEEAAESVTSA
ncbi:hypothetical protein J7E88_12915 [Streptomyces sp. ISL-10]|uniref:hypothetical protein n=1 Tax=Streptomyces sp. ISL-10 TaxID=2819172 RepID=UPI001BE74500|nr:hypothetical protein [Streptomyces sp. ISL-10]MBT2366185.1 hypothetical protein [Streptomyces sp. ISL-10]